MWHRRLLRPGPAGFRRLVSWCAGLAVLVGASIGSLVAVEGGREGIAQPAIREAVVRGLAVVERSARNYPEHRSCFSCHHQTLPLLAMTAAAERGLPIDRPLADEIVAFSRGTFASRHEPMREGKGIGGESMTVGYGLWALALIGADPDETTEAMVDYLLVRQEPEGHWKRTSERPPLEESNHFATLLAERGLARFGGEDRRPRLEQAAARADEWFAVNEPISQEDLNALLWRAVERRGADQPPPESQPPAPTASSAKSAVLGRQQPDGGWGQLGSMPSDAYATGQTLYVLSLAGMGMSDPEVARAARFLVESQCEDGSWFVASRSVPIQKFFDNGDPHGRDQFISIPATAWAVAALASLLPEAAPDGAAPAGQTDR